MSRWIPELLPNAAATDRKKIEYLGRSFDSISTWSQLIQEEYVRAGYGGIYRETPTAWSGAISTSWLIIGGYAYTETLTPNPIGVTQDLTNGYLAIDEPGLWQVSIALTADITPVTSNASNTVQLAAYDVAGGQVGDQPLYFTVPRYGESLNFNLSVPARIPVANVGKNFALAIATKKASPSITITNLISVDFHAVRIAGEEAL